jgi:hypothetical protein
LYTGERLWNLPALSLLPLLTLILCINLYLLPPLLPSPLLPLIIILTVKCHLLFILHSPSNIVIIISLNSSPLLLALPSSSTNFAQVPSFSNMEHEAHLIIDFSSYLMTLLTFTILN